MSARVYFDSMPLQKDDTLSFLRDATDELAAVAALVGDDPEGQPNDLSKVAKNGEALAKDIENEGISPATIERLRHFGEDVERVAATAPILAWQKRVQVVAVTIAAALHEHDTRSRQTP